MITTQALAAIVREYTEKTVAAALAPVLEEKRALEVRVKDLEARMLLHGEKGDKGDAGPPGRDGVGVSDALLDRVGHLVLTFSDGRVKDTGLVCGQDGAAGPPGAAGLNGKDGVDGLHGKDGRDGIDGKDGADGLHGKDGRDGLDGKDGAAGLNGKDGRDGLDGKDGAAGLNGKDGRDGVDGMTLEAASLDCTEDGWALTLAAGGQSKAFPLPWPFDLGPWVAGTPYKAGSSVSWDGSAWLAKADTTDQPGQSTAWRCVVRRGKQGPPGQPGKDGRDLRPGNTPDLYAP